MSVSLAPLSPRRPRKRTGPTVSILILNAISSYGGSRGVSLVALKKVLKASGYDVTRNRGRIRLVLRRLVAQKVIVRTRGKGVSGSFKLNPKAPGGRRRRPPRGGRRSKKKKRRRRGRAKRRKAQGRRARRGRSRRRRRRSTPARKRSTRRRRRRRAPRRKTPKRVRSVRRKRAKPAKVRRRRRRRMSGRLYK
ncbi:protamine-like protein [Syngnathoides biaculeatus]|uniref:protamine-like protein n=1 Tax=Syngnathoides biaculeatus TaxID=300417 RepID=UPI002ADE0E87|nr:protamine-like protein [Syngnathoides biaculeatus]